jgi:nitrous oxidase accessory protein NosD
MRKVWIESVFLAGAAVCVMVSLSAAELPGGGRAYIYVDDDADPGWYDDTHVATIQEGVDAAFPGDTVFVYSGYYPENVVVDVLNLTVIGEDRLHTIIAGSPGNTVVTITANGVRLENFTIKRGLYGVWITGCSGAVITRNIVRDNRSLLVDGLLSGKYAPYHDILTNGCGILIQNSGASEITENVILENNAGLALVGTRTGTGHRIHHNNFIDNTGFQAYAGIRRGGSWDNGYPSGGNYWSDHEGYDPDGDGISNIRYVIPTHRPNIDHYPFMHPYGWKISGPGYVLEDIE